MLTERFSQWLVEYFSIKHITDLKVSWLRADLCEGDVESWKTEVSPMYATFGEKDTETRKYYLGYLTNCCDRNIEKKKQKRLRSLLIWARRISKHRKIFFINANFGETDTVCSIHFQKMHLGTSWFSMFAHTVKFLNQTMDISLCALYVAPVSVLFNRFNNAW